MDRNGVVTGLLYFLGGLIVSSFLEYWAHRILHQWRWVGKVHRDHHAVNEGQGVLKEFWDYLRPSFWILIPPFFISWPAGIGWFTGCILFALFAAYTHQLQHENPAACFWMAMPTHFVHHEYNMWHYNFGISLDIWDRVFRTYKPVDWREKLATKPVGRGMFSIRWY